jgi:phenylalanyl-tRNA synthetase beta chain
VVTASDGRPIGWAGPLEADAPRWAAPLFGFELDVEPHAAPAVSYRPLPSTPASERDLALLVPHTVLVAEVLELVRGSAGGTLESVGVLDEYRGPGLPAGTRSVAIRLTFRAAERTLRDAEVDEAVQRVCAALEETRGVVLRTA